MTGCICVEEFIPLAWQCKHCTPIHCHLQHSGKWWCTSCLVGKHKTWQYWHHCW
jgi:hypothetical protein